MEGKKFIVGLAGVIVLLLLGGIYRVTIMDDRIVVSLPSDVCKAATLRVTKDDFTLKCGRYIAFQADTITEYYKTYGTDEWVRNNRFVGLNKKHITLELNDYEDYFEIVRKTRYRKGRQNIDDGVLYETYTFTKDKVKITYNYEVNNKALHRISMRIKKQVDSYLDAFDSNGHTGILMGNVLSYQGYGNLFIDPSITLHSPAAATIQYNEGDSIPLMCSVNQSNDSTLSSVKLYWNADNESLWESNGSISVTGNATVTFSRTIPHPITLAFPGTFIWNCEGINTTCTSGTNCTFGTNRTVDPRYKPEVPTIFSPNTTDLNLLNSTGWGLSTFYPGHVNGTVIFINWSHPGLRDNSTGILWNLSYYGTTTPTRKYVNFDYSTSNTSVYGQWNVSNLASDLYYVTLIACNALNTTLCSNDTLDIPVDIFDYGISYSSGETELRFSPMPTYTKRAALGQTASRGIIEVDWLGNRAPDGQINLSINHSEADTCMDIYAYSSNNVSASVHLANNTYVTAMDTTDADPDYIWLWATKASCGTTTTDFSMDIDLFFGGT
ncbi:hypothetical protein LCGC14_1416130 [marine sediment metagenome]|uniref:Ig-like domain-containing protein n=1 Tax=marine sediment metagenome TaxID=412755 RepID=A0A0F9JT74_9ZZZZ